MHHNDIQYWRYLQGLTPGDPELPSERVCRQLLRTMGQWKSRPGWLTETQVGHLFYGRNDLTQADKTALAAKPVIIRKALATERMLELIMDPQIADRAGSGGLIADEAIVGILPPFAVGQGKEFVRYLTADEKLKYQLDYLNELSPMGHIVPNHRTVIERGLGAVAHDARTQAADPATGQDKASFYEAVAIAVDAVIAYAEAYATLAERTAAGLNADDPNRANMHAVAACLRKAPRLPSETFREALQAIYIVHCALHWTVEIVPIGRLDQLLGPLYEADLAAGRLTEDQAQELIDCFWIKLDERVILNFRHAENRFTAADGVMNGFMGPSNYDQGGLLNQWMQQITIGGVLANDAATPVDACNTVTRLCLNAARRLPLNSPTLDLRVHRGTPNDILYLAAAALRSGGAHPVLLNDELIVPALAEHSLAPIPLADARDYACDGCYETMVAGQSEFGFSFISAPEMIDKTLNRGAGLIGAGPINLRGTKDSWRTPLAADIADFDAFQHILRSHLLLQCHRYLHDLLTFYGNKAPVCPSPLLSALISGCMQDGRDLTAGGANYHIFSPLLIGVSTAADSLHVIEKLVFRDGAVTLTELTTCLATDWGHRLLDVAGGLVPAFGPYSSQERISQIRALALAEPKFGSGVGEVDRWAWWLLDTFADCLADAVADPLHAPDFTRLAQQFGKNGKFDFHIAPGVGTFEQYVGMGYSYGASADGRRRRGALGSDLSPSPVPGDLPALGPEGRHARAYDLTASLRSYHNAVMRRFGDGAPVDYNVGEDISQADLVRMLRAFADGDGGSICTVTVADPETLAAAQRDPEAYNLVRVRMGGWTEFFITLFPDHQEQHKRRPLYA